MKNTFSVRLIYHFYHNAVKAELKRRGFPKNTSRKIAKEHKIILDRVKDIGKSNLLSSYIMGSYFIALNRSTSRSAEENYEIFRDGLCASKLFHKIMGDADSYLDPKRIPARRQWSEDSHKRKYENDWVVDILPGMTSMIWVMIITNVVYASSVRMKGVRSWLPICAEWIMFSQIL